MPDEDIKNEYDEIFRRNTHLTKILLSLRKENHKNKLIMALDFPSIEKSKEMVDRLEDL